MKNWYIDLKQRTDEVPTLNECMKLIHSTRSKHNVTIQLNIFLFPRNSSIKLPPPPSPSPSCPWNYFRTEITFFNLFPSCWRLCSLFLWSLYYKCANNTSISNLARCKVSLGRNSWLYYRLRNHWVNLTPFLGLKLTFRVLVLKVKKTK